MIGNGMIETNMYGRKDPQAQKQDPQQFNYTVCEACEEEFLGNEVLVYGNMHFCSETCLQAYLRYEAEVTIIQLIKEE